MKKDKKNLIIIIIALIIVVILVYIAFYTTNAVWDRDLCRTDNKCAHGGADCDRNEDCLTNNCVGDIGSKYAFHSWVDVCLCKEGTTWNNETQSCI